MLEFFKKLFNPEPSSVTARERLRLVLLSDHLALEPDLVESLKVDLIEVISRYVDVDAANCDVSFEQQDSSVAMLANIPIIGTKKKPPPKRVVPPPPPAAPEPAPAVVAADATAEVVVADAPEPSAAPETAAAAPRPRRRRRRRSAASIGHVPAAG